MAEGAYHGVILLHVWELLMARDGKKTPFPQLYTTLQRGKYITTFEIRGSVYRKRQTVILEGGRYSENCHLIIILSSYPSYKFLKERKYISFASGKFYFSIPSHGHRSFKCDILSCFIYQYEIWFRKNVFPFKALYYHAPSNRSSDSLRYKITRTFDVFTAI